MEENEIAPKYTILLIPICIFAAAGLHAQTFSSDNPYGIAGHGHYWDEVDSIHVKWARMWSQDGAALWGEIQPVHIDSFYWDDLDAWVHEIHSEGYHMLLTIRTGGDSTSFHPCKWTDHSHEPDVHPILPPNFILYKEASFPPRDYQEWYDFVYAVVERYDGTHTDGGGTLLPEIRYFETQAENDISLYWYGTKEEYYDQFLPTFYRAVHDANPDAVVIGGSVTGEGTGLTIIDAMIKAASDTSAIIDCYHHYFYDADNVTWEDIMTENTASQRRIEFVKYSFKAVGDVVYYDKRGFHNYERWNTVKDHMAFERDQMAIQGYSRPLWGTEVGIFDPQTFPLVPEHIHAEQYQKKMILQLAEGVEWFCFAPMTSNPNNFLTSIFSPMYSLVPFGTPEARELRDAFAFIAGKIDEVTGYIFDHEETIAGVSFYHFKSNLYDNTFIATWAREGETSTATIDIPEDLDSLIVFNYLGIPSYPTLSDSLTLTYTERPTFIEWEPSSSTGIPGSTAKKQNAPLFKVYPNPFQAYATVEFDNPDNKPYSLHLYNCLGQRVLSIPHMTSGQVRIDRGALASGIYFLELKTGQHQISVNKIMIN